MIMNLAFTGHQFTDKAKNTKTTMFKTFSHKKIFTFPYFNIRTFLFLFFVFQHSKNYAILDFFTCIL